MSSAPCVAVRLSCSLVCCVLCTTLVREAAASPSSPAPRPAARAPTGAPGNAARAPRKGRPRVKLNRLTFPDMADAVYYKSHLQRSLERETRLADWGADSDSVIEYRFRVDTLSIEPAGDIVRVFCAATGELPRRKNATSRLEFSGPPAKRRQLVSQVLEIVARGVITRLAQIEHKRRNP